VNNITEKPKSLKPLDIAVELDKFVRNAEIQWKQGLLEIEEFFANLKSGFDDFWKLTKRKGSK